MPTQRELFEEYLSRKNCFINAPKTTGFAASSYNFFNNETKKKDLEKSDVKKTQEKAKFGKFFAYFFGFLKLIFLTLEKWFLNFTSLNTVLHAESIGDKLLIK